jgi:hypothetical protein
VRGGVLAVVVAVVGAVGGRRDGVILHLHGGISYLPGLGGVLGRGFLDVLVLVAFALTVEGVVGIAADDVGLEEVGDFADVHALQFFAVDGGIVGEVEVEEVLGAVVLVHADVLELEFDLDVAVGEEGGELDELVAEVLDELVVDVGDPGLQLDGDVLEQEVHRLLLLQHRLDPNHVFVLQPPQDPHLLEQPVPLLHAHFVDLTNKHSCLLACYLLALPERVVLLHYHDHLLRHKHTPIYYRQKLPGKQDQGSMGREGMGEMMGTLGEKYRIISFLGVGEGDPGDFGPDSVGSCWH